MKATRFRHSSLTTQ